ncbi:MAG: hypothetical protein P4L67_03750 [Candidatus Pacebacteria bacterium]|nr:hypothetical protein [Candidatus Paceibacterota bacterium]
MLRKGSKASAESEEEKTMYTLTYFLSKEEKFRFAGAGRVRAKVITEKRDSHGKHECNNPACPILPVTRFEAKSTKPFVAIITRKTPNSSYLRVITANGDRNDIAGVSVISGWDLRELK